MTIIASSAIPNQSHCWDRCFGLQFVHFPFAFGTATNTWSSLKTVFKTEENSGSARIVSATLNEGSGFHTAPLLTSEARLRSSHGQSDRCQTPTNLRILRTNLGPRFRLSGQLDKLRCRGLTWQRGLGSFRRGVLYAMPLLFDEPSGAACMLLAIRVYDLASRNLARIQKGTKR